MSAVATLRAYAELRRNQWLDRDRLRGIQEAKLRRLVDHAYRTVPFYRRLFDGAGVHPSEVRTLDDLSKLPVITKADLQAAGPDALTSTAFDAARLHWEDTTGSTGEPFATRLDPRFIGMRNALFLRALTTAGYRVGQRLMLVANFRKSTGKKHANEWLRWRYASIEDSAPQLLAGLQAFRPSILYGSTSPLRQLASFIAASNAPVPRLKAVITTSEMLDEATRRLLEDAFRAEVFDFYGLTETGFVAWECPRHDGYHLAEDTSITELAGTRPGEPSSLVITNLELMAMPIIRFRAGDLAVAGPAERCACGRGLRRIARIEGRIVDIIRLPDGTVISPYRVTLAVKRVAGLRRFQVVQEDRDSFTLRFESSDADAATTGTAAGEALQAELGPQARLTVRREASLDPPPGRKYRVVESRMPPTPAR